MAIVYLHKRKLDNEVFYIGIGKEEKRAFNKSQRNNFWKNYVDKYEYFVEILCKDISWEEACEKEKELICFYGRRDLGFGSLLNMTDGGEGNLGATYMIGRKLSDEVRLKLSKSKIGNTNRLGIPHTEEIRAKLGRAVIQYDLLGNELKDFFSIGEACNITSVDKSSISRACKGRQKTAGGYKWKYKDE